MRKWTIIALETFPKFARSIRFEGLEQYNQSFEWLLRLTTRNLNYQSKYY